MGWPCRSPPGWEGLSFRSCARRSPDSSRPSSGGTRCRRSSTSTSSDAATTAASCGRSWCSSCGWSPVRRPGRVSPPGRRRPMLSSPPSPSDAGGAQTLPPAPHADPATVRDAWPGLALLAGVAVILFVIRLTGAPNLLDNEFRVGACALDVLQHGNWLCPHDVLGNTDKPPMLTWLTALASWPLGRVSTFTLYLPTAAATLLTAWIVAVAGGRRFGRRAGIFGGLAFLLSQVGAMQMGTTRWD